MMVECHHSRLLWFRFGLPHAAGTQHFSEALEEAMELSAMSLRPLIRKVGRWIEFQKWNPFQVSGPRCDKHHAGCTRTLHVIPWKPDAQKEVIESSVLYRFKPLVCSGVDMLSFCRYCRNFLSRVATPHWHQRCVKHCSKMCLALEWNQSRRTRLGVTQVPG